GSQGTSGPWCGRDWGARSAPAASAAAGWTRGRSSRPRSGSTATANTGRSSSPCWPPCWRTWTTGARASAGRPPAADGGSGRRATIRNRGNGGVPMDNNKVVSQADWLAARKELLRAEKDFTRLRDELSQKRRDLPWVRVDKRYLFDGPNGKETVEQLFDGCSQLVVYHFMYGPDSKTPCKSCSFWADNFERNVVHLKHRDVTMIAVSRAP